MSDETTNLPAQIDREKRIAEQLEQPADAETTKDAYRSDWRHYGEWCQSRGVEPVTDDPSQVVQYFAHMASEDYALSTIERRAAAIARLHREHDVDSPTDHKKVRNALANLRSSYDREVNKMRGLRPEHLRSMIDHLYKGQEPSEVTRARDSAMLTLGFSFAARRSEIANLRRGDVEQFGRGIRVTIRKQKASDDTATIPVPYGNDERYCPVRRTLDWIDAAGIDSGPLFRRIDRWGNIYDDGISGPTVHRRIRRHIEPVLDSLDVGEGATPDDFGGHSLRRGFIQHLKNQGYDRGDIMAITRHKTHTAYDAYEGDPSSSFDDVPHHGL